MLTPGTFAPVPSRTVPVIDPVTWAQEAGPAIAMYTKNKRLRVVFFNLIS